LLRKSGNCQLYFKKSNCILFQLYGFSKVILQLTRSELIPSVFTENPGSKTVTVFSGIEPGKNKTEQIETLSILQKQG